MGVPAEALVEAAHLLVHHGVEGDTIIEVGLLRGRGQLAVKQEIAGLEEVAVLGQLLNGVAAIEQEPFVAVDIRYLGLAASGRGVAGIVGEHSGFGVEFADIDHGGSDRSVEDRERRLLVAKAEGSGFDVGAGLRIHELSPRFFVSAVNLKFLSFVRQARVGTSNSKPHWNHKAASAPLIPKFALEVPRVLANFGIGPLADRTPAAARANLGAPCRQAVSGNPSAEIAILRSLSLGALQDVQRLGAVSSPVTVAIRLLDYRRRDLVADPGEAFLLPKHGKHLEDGRRCGAPGECSAQRLRDAPELHSGALSEGPDDVLGRIGAPWLDRIEIARQLAQKRPRLGRQYGCRRLVDLQRTRGGNEARTVHQLYQGLGPFLQGSHGGEQLLAHLRRQGARELGSSGQVREHAVEFGEQISVGGPAQIMAIEALELGEVEARGRTPDLGQVEGLDQLLGGEDFLVAMAPTQ